MEATNLDYYLLHGGLDQGFSLGISLMCWCQNKASYLNFGFGGTGP